MEGQTKGQCVTCRSGQLEEGTTTVTLERGEVTVVFKEVPALVCRQCGADYLDGEIVDRLHDRFNAAYAAGAIFDLRRWKTEDEQDELEHA